MCVGSSGEGRRSINQEWWTGEVAWAVGVISFPTIVPGSGHFQLPDLADLGHGLWLQSWLVLP